MLTIYAINKPDAEHLAEVVEEMRTMGAPRLRAIADCDGAILALEGSHRLAAAQVLGLVPVLEMVGDDDELDCDELGYDDYGTFGGEPARAADIRDLITPNGRYTGLTPFASTPDPR